MNRNLPWNSVLGMLILALAITSLPSRAHANVYATNVRVNNGTTNITALPGGTNTIAISYLLNEPASLGATVQIFSGTTVVTNMFFAPETQGALRGINEVTWDGTQSVGGGTYSVRVIAAASGYTNWTQITSDTADLNTYVSQANGIAVDRNPASQFYGRIFLANSLPGPGSSPGDNVGILKFNADTSEAEEGISNAGSDGHIWTGANVSPWKLEVSDDDYVYVDDLANGGEIFRWDPTISSNSLLYVLRSDNRKKGAALSGPAIVGTGTSTQILMGNMNAAEIFRWSLEASSVCASNDTGTVVISNTGSNFFDVAVDKDGNIYTCANTTVSGDPIPRVLRFPAGGSASETNAVWAVGGGDDTYAGASGIAVDPTGTYVAVAFGGPAGGFSTNGNTKILWVTNGTAAANLDLGVSMQGDANHDDTACAWDAVGNVYYVDVYFSRWRTFSPPGTNQASTVALANIQMSGSPPPPPSTSLQITKISVSGGNVSIDFSAGTNDTASTFTILGSAVVTGPFSKVNSAVITQVGQGQFNAVFPLGPTTQYFRISRQGVTPPPSGIAFNKASISGLNIVLTFSGNASDPASVFTLLGSATANGSYSPMASAVITLVSPGIFQASVPSNGPVQFYRIRR